MEELKTRDSSYFDKNSFYVFSNSLNQKFCSKPVFINGYWYLKSDFGLEYKAITVNCIKIT